MATEPGPSREHCERCNNVQTIVQAKLLVPDCLGWAVKLAANEPFIGRDALAAQQRRRHLDKRLACFSLDDPSVVLLGRETIFRNGERVGWLSSAGWGYTVRKNIGLGYVRNEDGVDDDYLRSGTYELEVETQRHACEIHLEALYDPDSKRLK